jgi:hypothetical protein
MDKNNVFIDNGPVLIETRINKLWAFVIIKTLKSMKREKIKGSMDEEKRMKSER